MTIDDMKEQLKNMLHEERYRHSLGVAESALQLAVQYRENEGEAVIAGLLHDCAKDISDDELLFQCGKYGIEVDEVALANPRILHGRLGAEYAKRVFEIDDVRILDAIKTHTTGGENMNLLQKIIFLADFIEAGRKFEGADKLRKLAFEDLDKAVLEGLDLTIISVLRRGRLLHSDTVKARNYLLLSQGRSC